MPELFSSVRDRTDIAACSAERGSVKEYAWAIVDCNGDSVAITTATSADDAWARMRTAGMIPELPPRDQLQSAGWHAIRVRLVEVGPA